MKEILTRELKHFYPGYFALTIIMFFPEVKKDLISHSKGPGFLSFVAASCILGTGYIQLKQAVLPATLLLIIGFLGWLLILYSFLLITTLKEEKPSFREGMSGSWLLTAISTASMAVLTALLAPHLPFSAEVGLFISILLWLLGILFFIIFVTLVIYRLNFFPVKAEAISPSFWMDAGAAALIVVAGLTIVTKAKEIGFFTQFAPVIQLLVLLFWAAASWWLVLLVLQESWRHYKIGFHYTPGYWSLVFPLGMYAVATFKISTGINLPFLNPIGNFFTYTSWIFWIIVFIAMSYKFLKILSNK